MSQTITQSRSQNVANLTTSPPVLVGERDSNANAVNAQITRMLRGILDKFPEALPNPKSDAQRVHPAVLKLVQERVQDWDLGMASHLYKKAFDTAYTISITAYNHIASPEVQAEIALHTAIWVILDDALIPPSAVEEFVPRFCSGTAQLHPTLDRMVDTCHGLKNLYATFAANVIFQTTVGSINCEHFQSVLKEDITIRDGSVPYIKYMRSQDGISGTYAAFVWPKASFPDATEYIQAFPDTMEIIDAINDIFSYYKEMKAGETRTLLVKLASANRKLEIEELEALINRTEAMIARVRGILGEGKAREAWESFVAGYIRYHLQAKRYRLVELLPEIEV